MYRSTVLQHHTKTKGDLGVIAAEFDLVQRGLHVLIPRTEHAPFDLVAYDGGVFYRIQVKYRAAVNGRVRCAFKSVWNDRHGTHCVPMDKGSVDVVAIYCPETKLTYFLDPRDFRGSVDLRIEPPKNNQRRGTNLASDFREFPPRRLERVEPLRIRRKY